MAKLLRSGTMLLMLIVMMLLFAACSDWLEISWEEVEEVVGSEAGYGEDEDWDEDASLLHFDESMEEEKARHAVSAVAGCVYEERFEADLDFRYKEYQCESLRDYALMGDSLLQALRAQGYGFLDHELDWESWTFDFDYDFEEDEQDLVYYHVEGNHLGEVEQEELPPALEALAVDTERHDDLWELFVRLIPREAREDIAYFTVFAHDDTSGYVDSYEIDDRLVWNFALNSLDIEPPEKRINTIVHELAHTYTLHDTELDQDVEEQACFTLHLEYGCAREGSLMLSFHEQFWRGGDSVYTEEDYVHEYAATSVTEDIAETFAYYVLEPRPDGDEVRDRKLLFFYEIPEYVVLRTQILSRLTALIEQQWSEWIYDNASGGYN